MHFHDCAMLDGRVVVDAGGRAWQVVESPFELAEPCPMRRSLLVPKTVLPEMISVIWESKVVRYLIK